MCLKTSKSTGSKPVILNPQGFRAKRNISSGKKIKRKKKNGST